jgi:tRNA(Glu) U13 pseudouridine synthase TruD
MKRNGVGNFFGPQRFGGKILSCSSDQHQQSAKLPIGFLCAFGRYQEAVMRMFDKEESSESPFQEEEIDQQNVVNIQKIQAQMEHAKSIFRQNPSSKTADIALKLFPSSNGGHSSDLLEMLRELRKDFDYKKAMCGQNFNLRQIRVHSAQSLIFNELLSKRFSNKDSSANEERSTTSALLPLLGRQHLSNPQIVKEVETIIQGLLPKNISEDDQLQQSFPLVTCESFIQECEAMLNSSSMNFQGANRTALMFPKDLNLEFDDKSESAVLKCQLPAGSFVSVVLRELLGDFPKE